MKRKLAFFAICILLLLLPAASIAEEANPRVASDETQRAQLRLRELGYYHGSIDGANTDAFLAAQYAFCDRNGIRRTDEPPAKLFTVDAIPAPYRSPSVTEKLFVTGQALTWEQAEKRLEIGEAYSVTACYGGVAFHLRYDGGHNHAHMTPYSDDDATALAQIFGEVHDYSKQPVVIRIGGISAAGSLMACRHSDDAGDADTEYSLYFTGSLSDIGGLPDVDHENVLRIAAGHE